MRKKQKSCWKLWVSLVIVAVAGSTMAKETNSAMAVARQLNQAFIEVAETVSASVVVIQVAHKANYVDLEEEYGNPFWDLLPREYRKQLEEQREKNKKQHQEQSKTPVFDGQGSGVVIREDGYILTNGHVVDGADKIKVRFKEDLMKWYDAVVQGVDTQSDIAVLKINPSGRKLAAAKMGDSDKLRVGEFAIAIGAPFELDYSVTFGHVSAKGRSRIIPDPRMDQDFIQTDASINPGNSGGPLVNIDGEVIGINTLIRGLRTGIGFAIPINLVKEISDKLVTDGKYVRSFLGIAIRSLKEDPEYGELVSGVKDGVVVHEIPKDAPARKSELKVGDIITAVDGKPVTTAQQLRNAIRPKKVGQTVTLDVFRDKQGIKVAVKTGAWPDEPSSVATRVVPEEEEVESMLGLTVKTVTKEAAEQFAMDDTKGVIVTKVEQGSPAERKGLRPGDIITEVNQKTVGSPKQFREMVKAGDLKKGVIVNFTSRGTSKFEVIKESGE